MKTHMQSPVGARVVFNGRTYDYFSGCGYLGLQSHPQVIAAASEALAKYGISTATSRGSYGEHAIYDELEEEACRYFGAQKSLYFASGYMGAAILTQACGNAYEHIFIDSASHFSLWDAAQTTNRPTTPFHHLRPQHLAECLKRELLPSERPLILSDGVFPISGEIASLPDYVSLAKQYDGLVFLDDAHAAGVLGKNGRGTSEYIDIDDKICRSCTTLSKALGGYGGLICGEDDWIDDVDRNSRIMAGASPPPLPMAAASAKALMVARTNAGLRLQLRDNVVQARQGLNSLGWELEDTPVPILCLGARDGIDLLRIKNQLFYKGIAISLVRSYTSTPPGGALRIAIFATHTSEQIERLISTIGSII